MRPINKYILVNKIDEELKTDGGLLLSQEDAKSFRYAKAKVHKVGHNVDDVVKDGDMIYFDKSAGHTVLIENEPYTIIREADIVIVL